MTTRSQQQKDWSRLEDDTFDALFTGIFFSLFGHISTLLDRVIAKSLKSVRTSEERDSLPCQISFSLKILPFSRIFWVKIWGPGDESEHQRQMSPNFLPSSSILVSEKNH